MPSKKKLEQQAQAAAQAEQKAFEQKMKIKRTLNDMNKFALALEPKKQAFIEKARAALMKKDNVAYKNAALGLKITLAHQRKVESLLLNYDIMLQLKDMTGMTADFMSGLGLLAQDLAGIGGNVNFAATSVELNKAMGKMQMNADNMDMFLDNALEGFDSIGDSSGISDKDIEALIKGSMSSGDSLSEGDIDDKLKDLERLIKGE